MADNNGPLRDDQYSIARLDDAHSRIAVLDSRPSNVEGQLMHLATKADVEKARSWMLVSMFGAIISIGTLVVTAD
ncbi:MAG: hypothetical protein OXF32_00115 [Anaerolineaceae bacterium]|nr:hypothetical protein [Anaerolineaceae bacterium]